MTHLNSSFLPTEAWNLITANLSAQDLQNLSYTGQDLNQLFREKIHEFTNRSIFIENLSSKNEVCYKLRFSGKKLNLTNFKLIRINHTEYFRGSSVDKFLAIDSSEKNLSLKEVDITKHELSKYSSPSISPFDMHTDVEEEVITWLNEDYFMISDPLQGTVQILNKKLESIFCSSAKSAFLHHNFLYLVVKNSLYVIPLEQILKGADLNDILIKHAWNISLSSHLGHLFAIVNNQNELIVKNLDEIEKNVYEKKFTDLPAPIQFLNSNLLLVGDQILNLKTKEYTTLVSEGANFSNFQINPHTHLLTYDAVVKGKTGFVIQDLAEPRRFFYPFPEIGIRIPYKDTYISCTSTSIIKLRDTSPKEIYKTDKAIQIKTLKVYHNILFFIRSSSSQVLTGLDIDSEKIVFNRKVKFEHFDISNGKIYLAHLSTNKRASSKILSKTLKIKILVMNRPVITQNQNAPLDKKHDKHRKSFSK